MAINLFAVSTLMDNPLSSAVQYVVAAACVIVETVGLLKARQAWRHRRVGAAIVMVLATALAYTNTVSNELTFYNVNYANKSAELVGKIALSRDAAMEKDEIERRLARAGALRPIPAIEADITQALAKTVHVDRRRRTLDQLSTSCTSIRSAVYDQCGKVLALRSELATAVGLTPQVAKDQARLDAIRASQNWVTTVGVTHPGASLLAKIIHGVASAVWGLPDLSYVTDQGAQALMILLMMVTLQFFNMLLPVVWFNGAGAIAKAGVGITSAFQCTAAPLPANDTSAAAEPRGTADRSAQRTAAFLPRATAGLITGATEMSTGAEDASFGNRTGGFTTSIGAATSDVVTGSPRESTRACAAEEIIVAGPKAIADKDDSFEQDDDVASIIVEDHHKCAKAAAVKDFLSDFCIIGDGHVERSSNVHAAYKAIAGPKLLYGHPQLTRMLRKSTGHRVEIFQKDKVRHLRGLRLNDEGRRLLGRRSDGGGSNELFSPVAVSTRTPRTRRG